MRRTITMTLAALAGCSVTPEGGRGTASLLSSEEGDGPDAGVDAAPDAAPVDCGTLCLSGDRVEVTLVEGQWQAYRQATVVQDIGVDSAGGDIEVTLSLTGNFGTVGMADGVVVTVGATTPCPPSVRIVGESGANECRAVVTVPPGHSTIPVTLFQWNGDREGWALIHEQYALVLR